MRAARTFFPLLLAAALSVLAGCGGTKVVKAPDFGDKAVRLIAVMPFPSAGTDDAAACPIIRELILEELYFKGYPRIPLSVVDEHLNGIAGDAESADRGVVPPEAVGSLLGADAALYGRIEKWKTSSLLFYAPVTIRISMVLRSTRTGEELWQGDCEIVRRTCGFPKSSLKVKSVIAADEVIREVVRKTLSEMPDGPDCIGVASPKKGFFERWWPFGSS
ncbi:MAG TPA: DUF799 family lipoprotein [Syntrophales bacterium]|nr:DUF799 family lipoprotein [Syntrophales bacterium]HPX12374.1 DUF799 family lipoprotein [Syntrophales bacterium]HQB31368.1 DUF799 family lipoprotein [Syntrophales bacterium]HQN76918.1 DUF799 family lipoprotein [Syntrophales bacterium]HQQ26925.1 DUF799 family lipoprotein [Syntrophales bacterium]